MANDNIMVSKDDLRQIVRQETRTVMGETFVAMGVSVGDPKSLIEMQKDFQHLRFWRKTVEDTRKKGVITAIGLMVTGVIAALWIGVQQILKS